jgi:hypothetical protein
VAGFLGAASFYFDVCAAYFVPNGLGTILAGFSDHDLFDNAFLFAHHRFLARFPDLRYGVRISIPVADDRSTGRRSTTTVSSCN